MTKISLISAGALLLSLCSYLPVASACDISKAQTEIGSRFTLQGSESISNIEKKNRISILVNGKRVSRVFGYSNENWRKFKSKVRNGDCVVHFNTPDSEWNPLEGGSGYALIRKGHVVESFLVRIS